MPGAEKTFKLWALRAGYLSTTPTPILVSTNSIAVAIAKSAYENFFPTRNPLFFSKISFHLLKNFGSFSEISSATSSAFFFSSFSVQKNVQAVTTIEIYVFGTSLWNSPFSTFSHRLADLFIYPSGGQTWLPHVHRIWLLQNHSLQLGYISCPSIEGLPWTEPVASLQLPKLEPSPTRTLKPN